MKKTTIYFILLIFVGCQNGSNILPGTDLKYLKEYHCWPYDVNIYSVNDIKIDSLFYTYPLKSYFGENPKYKITTWTKYDEIDTTVWHGMNKTLEQCDDNIELYNQLLKRNDIYYAGIYQNFKVLKGEKKRKYEIILFLDLVNNRLHIFKDINKVY
jgi:hypothetical protein